MGLGGLEPPTSRLSGARSNQLSYRPSKRPLTCRTDSISFCFKERDRPFKTRQQA